MQMLPLHLHLHHSENSSAAGAVHAVDMHIADIAADELHHADAHVVDLSADTIIKSAGGDSLLPLLFICLLTLSFIPSFQRRIAFPELADSPPQNLFLIFSPLRAPPRA